MNRRLFAHASRCAVLVTAMVGVTGAVASPTVWVVDNSAAPHGDGSFERPLATLAEAEHRSGPGESIYVRTGDGSTRGLDTGIRLKTGQVLKGTGVVFEFGSTSVPGGTPPTITNPNGHGVVLASGCEVAGLSVALTRDAGLFGADVGDLRLHDLQIRSTGGAGIKLRNPTGLNLLTRIEIDGAAGDGISVSNSSRSAQLEIGLVDCRLDDVGNHGVTAHVAGEARMGLTVDGCRFEGIGSTALALTVDHRARAGLAIGRSSITGAGMGIDVTVLDSGRLDLRVEDNPELSAIAGTIVNLFVDPGSTPDARVWGVIQGNPEMSKKPGSGFGIRISGNGDGEVAATVRDNRITGGVTADFGILAEARLGGAQLDLELTGNHVEVGADALAAIAIRSRDSASVCARIEGNTVAAAGGRAGLRLQQRGESILALTGLATDGLDEVPVERYLASANPGIGGVAATADEGFSRAGEGCSIPKEMVQ